MIDLNNTWCEATEENYDELNKHIKDVFMTKNGRLECKSDILFVINNIIDSGDISFSKGLKQIHLVNGEFQYVETKPKNNFEDYGFEADFEGEILKEVKELKGIEYLGYFVGGNKTYYPCIWTKSGRIWKTSVSEKDRELYNLKPIKKEWYENPNNFPCLVIHDNKESVLIKYYNKTNNKLISKDSLVHYSIDRCRPATKEEVLSLLFKE